MCAALGPQEGSGNSLNTVDAFAGIRDQEMWVSRGFPSGPPSVLFHTRNAWLKSVAFDRKLSNVSVEFTSQKVKIPGWSEAFLPTLGLCKVELIPILWSSQESPIPECIRMKGVPTMPAHSTTSFDARTCRRGEADVISIL